MNTPRGPVWVCPRCGRAFRHEHQSHSCAEHSVDELLDAAPPSVRALYRAIEAQARRCGPISLAATTSRILMQSGSLFCTARLGRSGVRLELRMARRIEHPRFVRVEPAPGGAWSHHLIFRTLDDLTPEVEQWLCDSHRWAAEGDGKPSTPAA